MLTNALRPNTWDEVVGQKEAVELLKSIAEEPTDAPKTLLFTGAHGLGKTTCSRLLAKELNGYSGDISDLDSKMFYNEHDSSTLSRIEDVGGYADLMGSYPGQWTVITFDEIHTLSSNKQSMLLKPLEDVSQKVFYIMITTEVEKIIKPLRSRSLEVEFYPVQKEELTKHLTDIADKRNECITDDAKEAISLRSRGHLRNAHILLNKYFMLDDKKFFFWGSNENPITLISNWFIAVKEKDTDEVIENLRLIRNIPLIDLKIFFEEFIWLCSLEKAGVKTDNSDVQRVVKLYGEDIRGIFKYYFSDLFNNIYRTDRDFQSGLLLLYEILSS